MDTITFVISGIGTSGGYRAIGEWASRLSASQHVVVASPVDGPGRAYFGQDVEIRVPKPFIGVPAEHAFRRIRGRLGPWAELAAVPRLVAPLIPREGRVIACYLPMMPGLPSDDRYTAYCQHWESVFAFGHRRAHRRAESAMTWRGPTIVNSTWLQSRFRRPEPPPLVFPGVDTDMYRPADRPRTPLTVARVVALGRTDAEWKGVGDLLEAITLTARPLEVVLFGTSDIGTQGRPWGTLRKVGTLAPRDLANLYRTADVVVCPSWYESFPLPPLEAMACGTPVVTTRVGTEDYAVDHQNALVVEPRDPPALAAAINEILDDPSLSRHLARAGQSTARRFTWDRGYQMFSRALVQTGRHDA